MSKTHLNRKWLSGNPPVAQVRLILHHEDHEGHEIRAGKLSHRLFVIFVFFVVVKALPWL